VYACTAWGPQVSVYAHADLRSSCPPEPPTPPATRLVYTREALLTETVALHQRQAAQREAAEREAAAAAVRARDAADAAGAAAVQAEQEEATCSRHANAAQRQKAKAAHKVRRTCSFTTRMYCMLAPGVLPRYTRTEPAGKEADPVSTHHDHTVVLPHHSPLRPALQRPSL
jgi:DNA topoisomerase IB